jgi:RES domain-containing protein
MYPDLDGKGAAIAGGRWNSIGTPIVYTSSCGALAVLEYRVHTNIDPGDLVLYRIDITDSLTIENAPWTPDLNTARHFGDLWASSTRSPVIAVPSVVVPHQINYLLNPRHPEMVGKMRIVDQQSFVLDLRLFDLTPRVV